jgi:ABC-type polysaccharide/polyol phosphate export permease
LPLIYTGNMRVVANDEVDGLEEGLPQRLSPAREAWCDLSKGFAQSWIWTALATQDIRLRYRGSVLGPFWLTLSMVIMVAAMGVIYSRLFRMEARDYLPYLALGLMVWQFISSLFIDGCQTFTAAESVIQQVPLAFSVHAYRVVYRNLLILAHNAVLIPIGMLIFKIPIDWRVLQIGPGLLILLINGTWISIFFGMISARFRDIPPIVASLLQVLFFATPIIWSIEALGELRFIADMNPVFAAIDVIRAPLLGVSVGPYAWPLLIATTIIGCVTTFLFFARFRTRIAFWI